MKKLNVVLIVLCVCLGSLLLVNKEQPVKQTQVVSKCKEDSLITVISRMEQQIVFYKSNVKDLKEDGN